MPTSTARGARQRRCRLLRAGRDVPLEPHEDEMYDDAPRTRRHGLATALALIGCAVLGTAGAYGYRSYYSHPGSGQPPPVITRRQLHADQDRARRGGDAIEQGDQDRVAHAGKEQIVSSRKSRSRSRSSEARRLLAWCCRQPVAPRPRAACRPAPRHRSHAPASARRHRPSPGRYAPSPSVPTGRRRRHGRLRPAAPITPPAPSAPRQARNGGPISLDPQAPVERRPAAPPRSAGPPPHQPTRRRARKPPTNSTGGFLVQLSSQRSEARRRAAFRSLQAKFPNELGGRQPIIRRADLGSKGIYYRTNGRAVCLGAGSSRVLRELQGGRRPVRRSEQLRLSGLN